MIATAERTPRSGLAPLHGILLAGTFPLFLGAALSDYSYSSSFHIQWATFASWLIVGGLVFNGFALLFAIAGLFRSHGHRGSATIYCLLLLASGVLGFINALVHARDAWAMMPTGLVLSIVMTVLAFVASWIGYARLGAGGQS
ncbi:DUF2231 domain-containing protein [Kushneria phosphatilytica]|uniref:Uncharacterized protein n=1 Tax=Kushneria phosphatilytica TaxID=657387 RepID=A0A1S1NZG1_9GAMM|nr:DUF2231 domain-containing protein [Kushneria phosphatilytica]OHV13906.1 hypothetical protein BH688_00735 [Kushneria phosphatilytica]QEL10467.1 hypothetical protein FY550_04480 [Kushneria phosphatilytica]